MAVLELTINRCSGVIERALRTADPKTKDPLTVPAETRKKFKEKCLNIKQRNNYILTDILNLKLKIAFVNYQHKIRNERGEVEMDKIMSAIKQTSASIKKKKNQL